MTRAEPVRDTESYTVFEVIRRTLRLAIPSQDLNTGLIPALRYAFVFGLTSGA